MHILTNGNNETPDPNLKNLTLTNPPNLVQVDLMALAIGRNNPIAFNFNVGIFTGISFRFGVSLDVQLPFTGLINADGVGEVSDRIELTGLGGQVTIGSSHLQTSARESVLRSHAGKLCWLNVQAAPPSFGAQQAAQPDLRIARTQMRFGTFNKRRQPLPETSR